MSLRLLKKKCRLHLKASKESPRQLSEKKVGTKADTVVTAAKSVKLNDLIKALKKKGYTAIEKTKKKSV